jgi:hypothetical protein
VTEVAEVKVVCECGSEEKGTGDEGIGTRDMNNESLRAEHREAWQSTIERNCFIVAMTK